MFLNLRSRQSIPKPQRGLTPTSTELIQSRWDCVRCVYFVPRFKNLGLLVKRLWRKALAAGVSDGRCDFAQDLRLWCKTSPVIWHIWRKALAKIYAFGVKLWL